MADPSSMASAGLGGNLLSGAVSAFGSIMSGNANANAYNYKAGIALLNAQIDKQNAAWVSNAGGIKASQEGLKDAQEKGQTIANQGASNIAVGSGSHAIVSSTQTDVAKFNQGIIRADAAHTAYGYETKAAMDTAEAALDRSAANDARNAGYIGALSSIIGTSSSVASKWSQGNTIGIGSSSGQIGTYDPNNYGAAPSWSA